MLQVYHPEVARVSCEQCKRWVYDKDWKPTMLVMGPGKREPMARPGPPPCDLGTECPKQHHSKEHRFRLHSANAALVDFFFRQRATGWALCPPLDALTQRLISTIHEIVVQADRQSTADSVAVRLSQILPRRTL